MRTFAAHEAKHALHGMTVVVETDGDELWIGRCDDVVAAGVILKDADVHRVSDDRRDDGRDDRRDDRRDARRDDERDDRRDEGRTGGQEGERSRGEWLERAKLYGVHPRHRIATVPAARVVSVRRLAEL